MNFIKLAYLLIAAFLIILPLSAPEVCYANPVKIYAFGDSITFGFAQTGSHSLTNSDSFRFLLSRKLAAAEIDARIVNGGVPGQTVEDAKSRFDKIFLEKPDVVIVMFGTNDCSAGSDGKSKVPLERYKTLLDDYIKRLRAAGAAVILMTPPPLPGDKIAVLTNRRLMPYVFAVRELAIRNRVDLVDNFLNFNEAAGAAGLMNLFLPDMIHPGARGHQLIADALFDVFINPASRYNSFTASKAGVKVKPSFESLSDTDVDSGVPASGINYAVGKNYIESARSHNCRPGVLTDGITRPSGFNETYYTSPGDEFPKWVIIDLGTVRRINSVIVYNSGELDSRNISLYYARELGSYNLITDDMFVRPYSRLCGRLDKKIPARYIKVAVEDSYGFKKKVSLAEIEVYGE